jgi:RHS repeat-associated protein
VAQRTTALIIENRFKGKERDAESGLDYFGTRYFGGAQGRFTSPDAPFADQHPSNPQSWNLYAYALNNPLRFVDDDGFKVNEPAVARAQKQINATVAAGGSTMTFVFLGINSGESRYASKATAQAIPEFSGMYGLGVRIPMMPITQSNLMPISAERSDAGLSQCERVIDISQDVFGFSARFCMQRAGLVQ